MRSSHENLEKLAKDLESLRYKYHEEKEESLWSLACGFYPHLSPPMLPQHIDNTFLAWGIKKAMRNRILEVYEQTQKRAERRVILAIYGFFSYFPDYLTEKYNYRGERHIKRFTDVPVISKMILEMARNSHYRGVACEIPQVHYSRLRRPVRRLFSAYSKFYSPDAGDSKWSWRKSLRVERERYTLRGRIASLIFDDIFYFLPWMAEAFLHPNEENGIKGRLESAHKVGKIFVRDTKMALTNLVH